MAVVDKSKVNIHNESFRQRISALSNEEVDIACDILVAMYPAHYMNALTRQFMSVLKTNKEVSDIYKERYHEYQRLIGNEPYTDVLIDTIDNADNINIISNEESVEESVGSEEINRDLKVEDIQIPSFLEN